MTLSKERFSTDFRLERYVLSTAWDQLPDSVSTRAKACLLDLIGALILGSKSAQFAAGCQVARKWLADGEVPVIGSRETFSLLGATVAMGHASNSFDIDDGHNTIKGHPGTSFISGLVAAASAKEATVRECLTALVVGYDVAVRCGRAMQGHYGYLHSTGSYGAVATAAVMGRLLGLSQVQLNNAIAIADFHAPMTPVMRAVEYPSMSKDGVPFGSMIGAMAVLETLAGETGRTYTLENVDQTYLLNDLGRNYEIMNIYFKPYTCCRWVHQPVRATLSLLHKHDIEIQRIESVTVRTFEAAARLSKTVPTCTDEAQYNISWPIASAIVHGDVGYIQVRDESLGDQQVIEMMQRLDFIVDSRFEAEFPERRLAQVMIRTNDGKTYESDICEAEGEAKDAVTPEWVAEKFKRVTSPVITPSESNKISELILFGDIDLDIRQIISTVNEQLR